MNDNLLAIKLRINAVKSIKKITNAMKLISSSRYSKIKNLFDSNLEYLNSMSLAMKLCLKYASFDENNLPTCLKKNSSNKNLYIIVSSNLGLCGSYIHEIEKTLISQIENKTDIDAIFIGERSYKHLKDRFNKSYSEYIELLDNLSFDNVNKFRHELDAIYRKENYANIFIVYTKYINSMTTKCVVEKLLPLEINLDDKIETQPNFEISPANEADLIVPHYLDAIIYNDLLQASLSEQTNRKNSMENSTTSANKLLYELNLNYNKARQAKITQEITEVISSSKKNSYI